VVIAKGRITLDVAADRASEAMLIGAANAERAVAV
jgi:hypothetical protein